MADLRCCEESSGAGQSLCDVADIVWVEGTMGLHNGRFEQRVFREVEVRIETGLVDALQKEGTQGREGPGGG